MSIPDEAAPKPPAVTAADLTTTEAISGTETPDASDPRWAKSGVKSSSSDEDAEQLPPSALAMVAERRSAQGASDALSRILAHDDPELPPAINAAPEPAPQDLRVAALGDERQTATDASPKEVEDRQQASPPPQTSSAPATGSRTVRTAANMRSGPGNSYGVLGVAPQGAVVSVVSCDDWCEILHDGKRGFVYKKFLNGAQQLTTAATADPAPRQKDEGRAPAGQAEAKPIGQHNAIRQPSR